MLLKEDVGGEVVEGFELRPEVVEEAAGVVDRFGFGDEDWCGGGERLHGAGEEDSCGDGHEQHARGIAFNAEEAVDVVALVGGTGGIVEHEDGVPVLEGGDGGMSMGTDSRGQSLGAGWLYSVTVKGLPATRMAASAGKVPRVGESTMGVLGTVQLWESHWRPGRGCCQ